MSVVDRLMAECHLTTVVRMTALDYTENDKLVEVCLVGDPTKVGPSIRELAVAVMEPDLTSVEAVWPIIDTNDAKLKASIASAEARGLPLRGFTIPSLFLTVQMQSTWHEQTEVVTSYKNRVLRPSLYCDRCLLKHNNADDQLRTSRIAGVGRHAGCSSLAMNAAITANARSIAPVIEIGDRSLVFGEDIRKMTDSTADYDAGNIAALIIRLKVDGYLYIRGFHDRRDVEAALELAEQQLKAKGAIDDEGRCTSNKATREGFIIDVETGTGVEGCKKLVAGFEDESMRRAMEALSNGQRVRQLGKNLFSTTPTEGCIEPPFQMLPGTTNIRAKGPNQATVEHADEVFYVKNPQWIKNFGAPTDTYFTIWTPLTDINSWDESRLALVPGSHVLGGFDEPLDGKDLLPGGYTPGVRAKAQWVTAEKMSKGDIVLFSMRTVHAATKQKINRFRLSLDARFVAHGRHAGQVQPKIRVSSSPTQPLSSVSRSSPAHVLSFMEKTEASNVEVRAAGDICRIGQPVILGVFTKVNIAKEGYICEYGSEVTDVTDLEDKEDKNYAKVIPNCPTIVLNGKGLSAMYVRPIPGNQDELDRIMRMPASAFSPDESKHSPEDMAHHHRSDIGYMANSGRKKSGLLSNSRWVRVKEVDMDECMGVGLQRLIATRDINVGEEIIFAYNNGEERRVFASSEDEEETTDEAIAPKTPQSKSSTRRMQAKRKISSPAPISNEPVEIASKRQRHSQRLPQPASHENMIKHEDWVTGLEHNCNQLNVKRALSTIDGAGFGLFASEAMTSEVPGQPWTIGHMWGVIVTGERLHELKKNPHSAPVTPEERAFCVDHLNRVDRVLDISDSIGDSYLLISKQCPMGLMNDNCGAVGTVQCRVNIPAGWTASAHDDTRMSMLQFEVTTTSNRIAAGAEIFLAYHYNVVESIRKRKRSAKAILADLADEEQSQKRSKRSLAVAHVAAMKAIRTDRLPLVRDAVQPKRFLLSPRKPSEPSSGAIDTQSISTLMLEYIKASAASDCVLKPESIVNQMFLLNIMALPSSAPHALSAAIGGMKARLRKIASLGAFSAIPNYHNRLHYETIISVVSQPKIEVDEDVDDEMEIPPPPPFKYESKIGELKKAFELLIQDRTWSKCNHARITNWHDVCIEVEGITAELVEEWLSSRLKGDEARFFDSLECVYDLLLFLNVDAGSRLPSAQYTNATVQSLMYLATHVIFVQTDYFTKALNSKNETAMFVICGFLEAFIAVPIKLHCAELLAECVALFSLSPQHYSLAERIWHSDVNGAKRYPSSRAATGITPTHLRDINHFIVTLLHVYLSIDSRRPTVEQRPSLAELDSPVPVRRSLPCAASASSTSDLVIDTDAIMRDRPSLSQFDSPMPVNQSDRRVASTTSAIDSGISSSTPLPSRPSLSQYDSPFFFREIVQSSPSWATAAAANSLKDEASSVFLHMDREDVTADALRLSLQDTIKVHRGKLTPRIKATEMRETIPFRIVRRSLNDSLNESAIPRFKHRALQGIEERMTVQEVSVGSVGVAADAPPLDDPIVILDDPGGIIEDMMEDGECDDPMQFNDSSDADYESYDEESDESDHSDYSENESDTQSQSSMVSRRRVMIAQPEYSLEYPIVVPAEVWKLRMKGMTKILFNGDQQTLIGGLMDDGSRQSAKLNDKSRKNLFEELETSFAEVRVCCGAKSQHMKTPWDHYRSRHGTVNHPFHSLQTFAETRISTHMNNKISQQTTHEHLLGRHTGVKTGKSDERSISLYGFNVCCRCYWKWSGLNVKTLRRRQKEVDIGAKPIDGRAFSNVREATRNQDLVLSIRQMLDAGYAQKLPGDDGGQKHNSVCLPFSTLAAFTKEVRIFRYLRARNLDDLTCKEDEVGVHENREDSLGEQITHQAMGRAINTILLENGLKLSISKAKKFMQCTVCNLLDARQRRNRNDMRVAEKVNKQRNNHLSQVTKERKEFERFRDQAK
jgi:hypothetical protein